MGKLYNLIYLFDQTFHFLNGSNSFKKGGIYWKPFEINNNEVEIILLENKEEYIFNVMNNLDESEEIFEVWGDLKF